jgi:hypothetical protein
MGPSGYSEKSITNGSVVFGAAHTAITLTPNPNMAASILRNITDSFIWLHYN